MAEYKGIEVRAAQGLHEDCFAIIERHFPKGSKILDLAAGAGAFSARLADAGYDVTANDIDDENWGAKDIPKLALDLNEPLDNCHLESAYAGVVVMEVIEHLKNPSKLLEDCKRLLAGGGYILLSTPNVMDIESRLIFLRSGLFFHFGPQSFFATGHRTILPYWLLEILFDEAGLEVVERRWGGDLLASGGSFAWLKRIVIGVIRPFIKVRTIGELDSNYLIYLLRARTGATPSASLS